MRAALGSLRGWWVHFLKKNYLKPADFTIQFDRFLLYGIASLTTNGTFVLVFVINQELKKRFFGVLLKEP
jgi:hypothetical protein